MDDTADTAQVIIRPPLGWGVAVIVGLALNWLAPLPFLPVDLPAGSLGAMVFVLALALVAWAIVTITRAGSNVPTNVPTTTIVESGAYRFTRNPIYLGNMLERNRLKSKKISKTESVQSVHALRWAARPKGECGRARGVCGPRPSSRMKQTLLSRCHDT